MGSVQPRHLQLTLSSSDAPGTGVGLVKEDDRASCCILAQNWAPVINLLASGEVEPMLCALLMLQAQGILQESHAFRTLSLPSINVLLSSTKAACF